MTQSLRRKIAKAFILAASVSIITAVAALFVMVISFALGNTYIAGIAVLCFTLGLSLAFAAVIVADNL